MSRDQELVGSTLAQHVDSHQGWRDDDRVNTIDPDGLHGMQAFDRLAVLSREGDVAADIAHCAAGLQAAHHVAVGQVLVHQSYWRVGENPTILQHPQGLLR
jgi:hypothetical protein